MTHRCVTKKKRKGESGMPVPIGQHRAGGNAGSTPASSTDDWKSEWTDFSLFRPVCISCGRIVFRGGFGFYVDGELSYACSVCEGRVH